MDCSVSFLSPLLEVCQPQRPQDDFPLPPSRQSIYLVLRYLSKELPEDLRKDPHMDLLQRPSGSCFQNGTLEQWFHRYTRGYITPRKMKERVNGCQEAGAMDDGCLIHPLSVSGRISSKPLVSARAIESLSHLHRSPTSQSCTPSSQQPSLPSTSHRWRAPPSFKNMTRRPQP